MKTRTEAKADTGAAWIRSRSTGHRTQQKRASGLFVLARFLWIPQALLIAGFLAGLLNGSTALMPGLLAGLLLLGVCRIALDAWADATAQSIADKVIAEIRREQVAAEATRRTDIAALGEGSAATAALLGPKLDLLRPYLTRFAPARARVMILPPLILGITACFSWVMALVLLVAGPLVPVFMAVIGVAARERSRKQLAEISSMNDLLRERLNALLDIRLLGASDRVVAQFTTEADSLRHRTMAVLRVAFLSSTVLELLAAIGIATAAIYVGFSLLGQISFGAYGTPLTAFQGIFLLLLVPEYFQPFRDLAAAWHERAEALAVADDLGARSSRDAAPVLGNGDRGVRPTTPVALEVSGLRKALPDDRVLRFPDFTLSAGQTLALSGPSGSGKSTLLALLAGLDSPDSGCILADGTPLDDQSADTWRTRIGWMPQMPSFPDDSLRHYLAGEGTDVDPARLIDALDLAQANDIISRLPDGLDTRPGESGGGLSGGEARRMSLARAFYLRPDLVLADEPTADLDPETGQSVIDGLLRLAEGGAAVICVSHDPVLCAAMARELVLEGAA